MADYFNLQQAIDMNEERKRERKIELFSKIRDASPDIDWRESKNITVDFVADHGHGIKTEVSYKNEKTRDVEIDVKMGDSFVIYNDITDEPCQGVLDAHREAREFFQKKSEKFQLPNNPSD